MQSAPERTRLAFLAKAKRWTYEKLPYEILCLFVKTLWERIFELLDFLPISKATENETACDHLIDDASQSPEI